MRPGGSLMLQCEVRFYEAPFISQRGIRFHNPENGSASALPEHGVLLELRPASHSAYRGRPAPRALCTRSPSRSSLDCPIHAPDPPPMTARDVAVPASAAAQLYARLTANVEQEGFV